VPANADSRTSGVHPKSPTVLVVEDDLLIRIGIAEYLRECGFDVIEASNADEAITVLTSESFPVEVVFTDVQMPGSMDGFGLAQWVRANRSTVKVIVTTGVARKANDAKELCGDGPLMPKPYGHGDVESRIRKLLAERDQTTL